MARMEIQRKKVAAYINEWHGGTWMLRTKVQDDALLYRVAENVVLYHDLNEARTTTYVRVVQEMLEDGGLYFSEEGSTGNFILHVG